VLWQCSGWSMGPSLALPATVPLLVGFVVRGGRVAPPLEGVSLDLSLRDELILCCLLAADAQVSLETPLIPVVSATDASLHHGVVIEIVCELPTLAWLWSRASLRGSYSNGAWPAYYTPGGELIPADDVMHAWISGVQFKEELASPFTKNEQIKLLEIRARKTWAVCASKSVSCWRSRHVRLMDSGVCTGALGRGRSSSRKLNGVLRSTLPFVGPTGLVVGRRSHSWTSCPRCRPHRPGGAGVHSAGRRSL
jgi:hypothetical protein